MLTPDFERVVEEARALQARFPDLGLVAVGGTAAALHCGHRVSMDVDHVTPMLDQRYDEVAAQLELWAGWTTNRLNPRVLILGERHGVELGLRQQRRAAPLATTCIQGLIVPTPSETIRIKAMLLVERRATRDYVDVAALADRLGPVASLQVLADLERFYPASGSLSLGCRLAEACESDPLDRAEVALASYRGLQAPFDDWSFVATTCRRLARELVKRELKTPTDSTLEGGGKP